MVCPVDHSPHRVPFIHPRKFYSVARFQPWHTRRHVDVMRDEHRQAGWQVHDKALMPDAAGIISQDFNHLPRARDVNVAEVMVIRVKDGGVARIAGSMEKRGEMRIEGNSRQNAESKEEKNGKEYIPPAPF